MSKNCFNALIQLIETRIARRLVELCQKELEEKEYWENELKRIKSRLEPTRDVMDYLTEYCQCFDVVVCYMQMCIEEGKSGAKYYGLAIDNEHPLEWWENELKRIESDLALKKGLMSYLKDRGTVV